ncbi:FIG00495883: hypothetical protein [hydrothermal vent metagenome]|uniref:Molybdenum carrier n=1 Tax=hydrothermal vent metagenome TaxID=652676 RepID=A0A3B0U3E7_9ZZZZ
MLCQKIISGGQTGVDRGALDAAFEAGFACGGWCPEGRMAEDGPIDNKYPLKAVPGGNYSGRTKMNVRDSDATLIIYHKELTGGTLLTRNYAQKINKPLFLYEIDSSSATASIDEVTDWVKHNNVIILNVAGPRQSEWQDGYSVAKNLILALIRYFSGA